MTDTLGTLFETVEDRSVAHAYAVLRGEDGSGLSPTSRQKDVLRILADRRGARRAVSAADLARTVRSNDRAIRDDVHVLRLLFHVRIGGGRGGEQSGYYLITTKEELMDTVRPFLSQATAELRLVRALCSKHELADIAGQMNLNLEDLQPKEISDAA